jgi:hypothetical protein
MEIQTLHCTNKEAMHVNPQCIPHYILCSFSNTALISGCPQRRYFMVGIEGIALPS